MEQQDIVIMDYTNCKVILLKAIEPEFCEEVVREYCESTGLKENSMHWMAGNKIQFEW
jgi:hypothetical protein